MTDKYLQILIDRLNKNRTQGLMHLAALTDTVDYGKVWKEKPKPTDNISSWDGPYQFYFVKDGLGLYVAVVLDMGQNLHWFVSPKHRKKGYLTAAMKNVILFHLFQDRSELRITINESEIGSRNFKASERVAQNLGFIKSCNNENVYSLSGDKYETENSISFEPPGVPVERIEQLKRQVNYIARSLWLVQTEVEMTISDFNYAEELEELVFEIKKQAMKIEDVWTDRNERRT